MKLFEKRKIRLSRHITWRVILIMLFFNAFTIGAVYVFDLAVALVEGENRALYLMDGIGGNLETMLESVEIASKNNVAEIEEHLDSPEAVFAAMEHELRLNKGFLGCGVAFEPDYFKTQGRWFEAYVKMDDSLRVERSQIGSARHDYFSQEWYVQGLRMERGQGYLSDPYLDEDGGKRIVCTYSVPVHDRQGRKVGVYGIDLNLSWLEASILNEEKKIKRTELLENDEDSDDEDMAFFIQILDSRGRKIAGSETLDDQTLQKILKEDSIDFKSMKLRGITYHVNSKRIARTGWTLVVAQHDDFVYLYGYVLGIVMLFFMSLGAIVIFFFTRRSINRAIQPLNQLSTSAQEVARGNFDTPLPTFQRQDDIAQLRDSFATMQQSLKRYVQELQASTAAKASIESELKVACDIQMSMLPKTFPAFPDRSDLEVFASLTPAKGVGGDLYDFFIRDEKLFFCIGDVSGKGVPAALVMAVTRTLFRNIAVHIGEPGSIVETMNTAISEGNDNNMFVTLFVGALDLHSGHLSYCNAGHDAPFMQGDLLACDANLPVGVMPGWTFSQQETDISRGSTLFLYTDGLTEAENSRHELFGMERLRAQLSSSSFQSPTPQELIEAMTDAVGRFVGGTEQSDDLTMLAIQFKIMKNEE